MLIIVCGLQGTGKTTASNMIAEKVGGVLFRTDVVRQDITDDPQFTEEENEKVYRMMFFQAEKLLKQGMPVVLDATFVKQKYRDAAAAVAKKAVSEFKTVEVISSEEAVKKRLREHFGEGSEAVFKQYQEYKKNFDSIKEPHTTLDNSGSLEDLNRQVGNFFGNSPI